MNMFSTIYRQLLRHPSSGSLRSRSRRDPWYSGEHSSINLRQPRSSRGEAEPQPDGTARGLPPAALPAES